MPRRKTVGGRTRGMPRMRLDEAERQWHGPRRRHIERHADAYEKALMRHVQNVCPGCLKGLTEVYDLAWTLRDELPSLCRPPFGNLSEMPLPVPMPSTEGDNRPPKVGPSQDEHGTWVDVDDGASWRAGRIAVGTIVPVEHRGRTLHFGEHVQYMMVLAFSVHLEGWLENPQRTGVGANGEYVQDRRVGPQSAMLIRMLAEGAMEQARAYVEANPDARIVGAAPPEPGVYDDCPPAQPTGEPRMDDGSHLLASERGRRRIDPETGRRMIRTMVLAEDAWPHWEWSEDVEGAAGVGPWGPGVSFGTPEEPAQMSPRESMRPYLTRAGRLDLLHKYLPWEGDPPL